MIPSKQPTKRRLRRFFSSRPISKAGETFLLSSEESNHMRQVLRLKEGDSCLLSDASGASAVAIIRGFDVSGKAEVKTQEILEAESSNHRAQIHVHLAMPQRGKMDHLVEKAQELGVDALFPIKTSRTVVKVSESQASKVFARWQRILQNAAKQSGTAKLLEIRTPVRFEKSLESISQDEKIACFHPEGDAISFSEWVRSLEAQEASRVIHLFIGPEGGFDEEEINALVDRKATIVHLGKSILKVETAFLSIVGALRLLFP